MHKWIIVEITEGIRHIDVSLKEFGQKAIYRFDIDIKNKEWLLKAFRSKNLESITNQSFSSRSDSPNTAIEILLIEARSGKRYTKPSNNKIYQVIASALAEMREPELSLFDSETVFRSIYSIWTDENPKYRFGVPSKAWLKEINKMTLSKSDGHISIQKTKVPTNNLPWVIGPCYFTDLVSIFGRRETILLTPSGRPIQFLKKT